MAALVCRPSWGVIGAMSKPPGMFRRPVDPPTPLPPLRAGTSIEEMHVEWAKLHQQSGTSTATLSRLRSKLLAVASRVGARDRNALASIVRAVDDVAVRCDELSQRVNDFAISLDDLARTYGEELTQLRSMMESMSRNESETPRSSS
jgi:hypothetical protein